MSRKGRTLLVAKSGLKQGRRWNAGREGTPVLTVVQEGSPEEEPGQLVSLIDEIVREGARRMLAEALQAEMDAYIARFAGERDENGRPMVVRNGYRKPREVLTSAGAVEVTAPRVNDKRTDPATGQRMRFSSAILPVWARKTPKITEVLPALPARPVERGLRARPGPVPRFIGRAVGRSDHEADGAVEGRAEGVLRPGSVRRGLRVPVGRRDPREYPPRGAQSVPTGHDRGARTAARSPSP